MLNKTTCNIKKAKELDPKLPICIIVNDESELQETMAVLEPRTSLKGIQLTSTLLSKLTEKLTTTINYVSTTLNAENKEEIADLILKKLTPKKQFIELVVPYNLFTEEMINSLEGVKRIIVDFSSTENIIDKEQINNLFAILISNKFFPFTKGLNQDQVDLRHMVEFYQGEITKDTIQNSQKHESSIKEFLETKIEGDLL